MNKGEAIDIVILHMALPENQNKDLDFYQLLNQLNIPKDIQKFVFQTMSMSRGYIIGPPTIKDPIVHITTKGLQYADELKENYFQEHGKPLNPDTPTNMTLDETCELLFQMHKKDNYKTLWTKSTYDNMPANLDVAKELLERRGVIYSKVSSGGHRYTHLHPDFYEVATCKEALQIAAEKSKPQPSVIHDHSIKTYGPNSPASGRDTTFTQTNNPEPQKKKWYQKWVDEFVKNAVQFAVTSIFTFSLGLITGKSCNQSNSPQSSQSTNQKTLQTPSDTIKQLKHDTLSQH